MELRARRAVVAATADGSIGGRVQSRVGEEAMRDKQVGQCVRGGVSNVQDSPAFFFQGETERWEGDSKRGRN